MTDENPSHNKGFIGETPNWGTLALGGFGLVAAVLALLILIFG
jgi:hypothetical protein